MRFRAHYADGGEHFCLCMFADKLNVGASRKKKLTMWLTCEELHDDVAQVKQLSEYRPQVELRRPCCFASSCGAFLHGVDYPSSFCCQCTSYIGRCRVRAFIGFESERAHVDICNFGTRRTNTQPKAPMFSVFGRASRACSSAAFMIS